MTKQEEIREGLSDLIYGLAYRPPDIDVILRYLHSQGVVIENKDEAIFHHGYFPLIEPLIEEGK